jgi:uncharacterized protein YeaO (DUF488 family)
MDERSCAFRRIAKVVFAHDPDKWQEFVSKYNKELHGSMAFSELMTLVKKHKTVTLLFSAKVQAYNQAVALKKFVEEELC